MRRFWALLITLMITGSLFTACNKDSRGSSEPVTDITDEVQVPDETSETPEPTEAPAVTPSAPEADPTAVPTQKPAEPTPSGNPEETVEGLTPYVAHPVYRSSANDITDVSLSFNAEGGYEFGEASTLYSNDLTLTITAPEGAKVYYTLDGTLPTAESTEYIEPLELKAHGGDFPSANILRAVAVLADGTISKVAARTYLAATNLEGRFSTLIFSVSGDPAELTEKPDGIFYGHNYNKRGRESERGVYVEAWRADGTSLIEQFAGVRIYGGYSRQSTIKSMKLFSRKSYDEEHKNFKFSEFGTVKRDGSDKVMKTYDKLVIRNFGNDMQFGFIRDELSQALCKVAGFEVTEACIPAVAYLNGEYYGFFWLHESYCDKFLKELYGDAEGEFYVLEGSEQNKSDDDDCQDLVDEYNTRYNEFISMDLTDDANYAKVAEFMDVEDYLDYYAWNIALNNWDWPNNNYKCFKYVEADNAKLTAEGAVPTPDNEVYDGRYRFLVHDMDYSYGIYDQYQAKANYNNLKVILNKNDNRYAPLFKALMERKDCRNYFRAKTAGFVNGALSEKVIVDTYRTLCSEREDELSYFYKYIRELRHRGDGTMWTNADLYAGVEQQILDFAKSRARYVLKYMDDLLPELE